MSIVTDKPLDVRAFTRDHSAFAAEVATNKVLAGRLMRLVELALQGPGDDDMAKDVLACETRLVLGMVAAECRSRSAPSEHIHTWSERELVSHLGGVYWRQTCATCDEARIV